jgi:hypothetical protein
MFRRFPSDVLPAGMNQLMKMAVLYDVGGAEPSTTGLKLLQLLLERKSMSITKRWLG